MIAEILATGDEIRSGALVDSNSAHIARALEEAGVFVQRHVCVGDDMEMLAQILTDMGARADIAVVTGGLGPTLDDLTAEAVARAAGVELALDQTALDAIEAFFEKRGRTMTASNRKQAFLPAGSERLDNPYGTAPGFRLKIGRCTFFFMPGVPFEMTRMLDQQVLPRIERLLGGNRLMCRVQTISTFGLTESATGERVAELAQRFPDLQLGLRAKFPEIQVKLYARGRDGDHLQRILTDATDWVTAQLGDKVFALDESSMEAVVGRLLTEQDATVAAAESCTGGLISHLLTNVAGSSRYFLFSGVTYANRAKIDLLGVLPETLERFGAVSEETAREMAMGARRAGGATFGIATSGIAGPDGGTADKPVGTVCIGLATPEGAAGRRFYFPFGERSRNKTIFAMTALELLRRELIGRGAQPFER